MNSLPKTNCNNDLDVSCKKNKATKVFFKCGNQTSVRMVDGTEV